MEVLQSFIQQRSILLSQLDSILNVAKEQENYTALILVKVENFSAISQSFGFEIGYKYLDKLLDALQDVPSNPSSVLPINIDTFAIILPELENAEFVLLAAEKIKRIFANPILVDDNKILGRPAVGIAQLTCDKEMAASSSNELFILAEDALVKAKNQLNRVVVVEPKQQTTSLPFFDLEEQLKNAIEQSDLELYFQPKINLKTGEISSFEALLRWNHEGKFIPPFLFIPIAEDSEIILDVTRWVINNALRVLSEQMLSNYEFSIAINVSKSCFNHEWIESAINNSLKIWGVAGSKLILEITETAFTDNLEMIQNLCAEIRNTTGCRISIDDYGTGYSSFEFFKDVHSDELKIDRSFVTDLNKNDRQQNIVRCMTELAQSANMSTVVEGIENIDELKTCIELGADYAQGYFIAKPMPEKDLYNWLDNNSETLKGLINSINQA